MGAYEFGHVDLELTGEPTPGGSLTVELTGSAGLHGWIWLGTGVGEWPMSVFGTLFVDLAAPWWLIPLGDLPSEITGTLPSTIPEGTRFVVQGLAVSPATGAGNFSNYREIVVLE